MQVDETDATRAVYVDEGPDQVSDSLVVSATRSGTTTTYAFYVAAPVVAAPPCEQTTATVATCVVANGTGVDIDIGDGAEPGARQTVTLVGSGWLWQENRIVGGDGPDVLRGSDGDEVIVGGRGADTVYGGAGADVASYEDAGFDEPVRASLDGAPSGVGCPATCEGDRIDGDVEGLTGGAGDDVLVGNAGPNTLSGGGGDDFLIGGLGDDRLDGGAGVNTADYSADGRDSGIAVDLAAGWQSVLGGRREDALVAGTIHNVVATEHADSLTGDGAANRLVAGAGDDSIDVVDGRADQVLCDGGRDTVTADDIDVLEDCESVTRAPTEPAGGGPAPPTTPCADADACRELLVGLLREVFGCDSPESCAEEHPPPGGGPPPSGAPCSDAPGCAAFVEETLAAIFDQIPGGVPPSPPCGDADACVGAVTGLLLDVLQCDSLEDCSAKYVPGGGGPPAPPAPCSDPAGCTSWLQVQFRERFGCDSPDSCRERYFAEEQEPEQRPSESPPAVDRGSPEGGSGPATTASSSAPKPARPAQARARVRLRAWGRVRRTAARPFVYVVRGRLVPARPANRAQACRGFVVAHLRRGRKIVGRGAARVGGRCRYVIRVRTRSLGRLRLVVRFAGNDAVAPVRLVRRVALRPGQRWKAGRSKRAPAVRRAAVAPRP